MGCNHSILKETMTGFERNTFEIFCPVLSDYGFRKALAASGSRRVSLVAKLNDDICAYVFVTDGRPGGGSLDIDAWIAPTDFPGDAIDRLGVGIKITVASSFEVDDAFMMAAALKLSRFVPHFVQLGKAVAAELAAPSINTERMAFYKVELDFIARLDAAVRNADPKLATRLESLSEEAASSGKKAYERLEAYLSDLVGNLNSPGKLALPQAFLSVPPQARGSLVAGHYYMRALLK
jgi:hypothetical protein